MRRENLPKKILMIKECTFILPDDFDGTLEEAFSDFLEYRKSHLQNAKYIDDSNLFSTFDVLLHSGTEPKACGHYGIYELVDGRYKLAGNQSHN